MTLQAGPFQPIEPPSPLSASLCLPHSVGHNHALLWAQPCPRHNHEQPCTTMHNHAPTALLCEHSLVPVQHECLPPMPPTKIAPPLPTACTQIVSAVHCIRHPQTTQYMTRIPASHMHSSHSEPSCSEERCAKKKKMHKHRQHTRHLSAAAYHEKACHAQGVYKPTAFGQTR